MQNLSMRPFDIAECREEDQNRKIVLLMLLLFSVLQSDQIRMNRLVAI